MNKKLKLVIIYAVLILIIVAIQLFNNGDYGFMK